MTDAEPPQVGSRQRPERWRPDLSRLDPAAPPFFPDAWRPGPRQRKKERRRRRWPSRKNKRRGRGRNPGAGGRRRRRGNRLTATFTPRTEGHRAARWAPAPARDQPLPTLELARRYLRALRHRYDPPRPKRQVRSATGRIWAASDETGLRQYQRARRLLSLMGMDPERVAPHQLRAALERLRASGVLQQAVDAARNAVALDPGAAASDGFLHTALAAHPILWGTDGAAGGINPVSVLELLRPVSRRWREPFATALIGADTAVVEPVRPRGRPPNYRSPGFTEAQLESALADEVARGWSLPVPSDWPKQLLRRTAPCKLVPKSGLGADGRPRARMVQDNSASAAPAALRGVNSRVDTSFLEFPKVPSAAELCQLIADMEDKHNGPLFLAPMDIQAAYRQLSAGAGATPLLTIASGKVTLMNVALPMGARFSASALCAATAALGDALRTDHTGVAVYADDILLVSACDEAGARADRDRAAELCGQLGLPVAVEKCPPPAHVADYVGLRFSSRSDLTLVSVKPSTLQKLLGALDSVRAGGRISVSVHEPMLGRAYWLSCLCLPIKAWIRRLAQEIVPAARAPRRRFRWTSRAESAAKALSRLLHRSPSVRVRDVADRARGPDPRPKYLLATDACGQAGGAVLIDLHDPGSPWQVARFEWPEHIGSSTRSELLTATRALQHFRHQVAGTSVHLLTDNVATQAVSSRFRASLSAGHADDLAEELAEFLLHNRVRLDASHIAGVDNICADRLSRLSPQVAIEGPLWKLGTRCLSTAASSFCATAPPAWPKLVLPPTVVPVDEPHGC